MQLSPILKGKCPQCKKGNVFNLNGNLLLLRVPEMNERCEKCNFKFEKEPGFFFGAMFVSYALAVAQFVIFFMIFYVILNKSPSFTFFGIVLITLLSSTLNFRLSRILWIYLFYKKE